MKKFSKKLLSLILAVLMMVSVMPMGMISAQAANGVENKLNSLQQRFPAHQYWSHYLNNSNDIMDYLVNQANGERFQDTVSPYACAKHGLPSVVGTYDCNYFDGAWQCWGFANKIFYETFGVRASATPRRSDTENIAVGDQIRLWTDGDSGHSAIVTRRAGNTIWVVDCNWGSPCIIRWGENAFNIGEVIWFKHASTYDSVNNGSYNTQSKPAPKAATIPSLSVDYADVAVDKNVTFSWSSSNASNYEYVLTSPSGEETTEKITASSKVVNLSEVGRYSFKVKAFNSEDKETSYSNTVTCTTHKKVNVQFVDWDNSPLTNKKQIDWGSDIQEPVAPSRKGYTFQNWDKSSKNVTEDRIIKAQYKINTYTVRFYDKAGKLLKSEKVDYDHDATPPENTNAPTGYVFQGWSSEEYKNVYTESSTRTIDIHGIYAWFNDDLPVVCEITSAKRQSDGYYVYFDLTNYDKGITRGRAVVSLKTAQGKLVDTTESTAFSIPVNGTKKGIEVFVPCDYAASKAEVIIVDSYSSGVPISENVSTVIDQGLSWTDWSPEKPDENNEYLETDSRQEYRYKTRLTTESYSTSLNGWTRDNYKEIKDTSKSGSFKYISSGDWPRDADTNNIISSTRSKLSEYDRIPLSNINNETTRRTVNNVPVGYLYWHWCFGNNAWPNEGNTFISDCYEPNKQETFHYYERDSKLSYNKDKHTYSENKRYSVCPCTYWWFSYNYKSDRDLPIYICDYTTYYKLYSYHKSSDWTEWSTEQKTIFEDKDTRTVYRYKDNSVGSEDNSGVVRTAKGKLDESFAGKQITLYVYGYIGASDFTNYYIGQSVVAEDGSYSFTYKLREEPTEVTGDYTVAIGIEGTTNTIIVDTIEAPKPKYTVNFYNWDGTIISTQTVTQGQDATLPADPTREGYDFKGWDKSITNVQEDMDVFSDFSKKEYEVIFVDWANKSISVQKYEHGDKLSIPETFAVKGFTFMGWDKENVENTIVTGNMVVSAEYCITKYTVKFLDFDGNVIDTQQVEYGSSADAPTTIEPSSDGKQFAGWFNPDEYKYVEDDLEIRPAYYFEETTDIPVANYKTGEYSDSIELTLTSQDKNAVIFYYLNNDQSTEKVYTKPIIIDKTCSVTYYATSFGKNNSSFETKYYCINSADKPSAWMLYSQIPQEVKENVSEYNLEVETGYRFKNVESVSTPSEVETLTDNGWIFDGKSYSAYTNWQDQPISVDTSKLGFEVDTQEVADTTKTRYQYSHYKYIDNGVTKYSNKAVDGFDCEYETVIVDNRLNIAGFTDDNITYYVTDGKQWFNQTKISGVKTQYRSRYQIATYYKWTDWDVVDLSSNETREYEENDLYRYSNVNYYLVTINRSNVGYKNTCVIIVKEDDKINLESIAITGYDLEGLYLDADFTERFDENTPINESIILYPKYTPKTYTVSFQMLDGTEIDFQEVEYMHSAIAPDADAVPGFVFGGWEDKFDCVTEDMIVYGIYYKESEYARISLDKTKANMYQGTSIILEPSIYPSNLSDSEIEWSVSDSSIATVNDKGVVTAVGVGVVEVVATVVSTRESAHCKITVTGDSSVAITLSANSNLNYDSSGYLRRVKFNSSVDDVMSQFQNKELEFINLLGNKLSNSDNVGTGTKINLYKNGDIIDTNTIIITGDMTGDGIINNRDVVMFNKYQVKKITADECQVLAMDVNGDGYVNNRDAAMIARYLVGKETLK